MQHCYGRHNISRISVNHWWFIDFIAWRYFTPRCDTVKSGWSIECIERPRVRIYQKGVRALRGYFGPLWSQKLKVAFQQFHLIGLLEE